VNEQELRTRVRNPNREFDSFFYRPRNRILRFIVNKYINIIEVMGYLFGLGMLAAIIYAWTVRHDEWTGWVDTALEPLDETCEAFSCAVELSGANVDSVGIGDSAQVMVASACDLSLTVNVTLADTALSARHVTGTPGAYSAFFDSLTSGFVGREITARDQGLYTVRAVERPDVVLEFSLAPAGSGDSGRTLSARSFPGVFAEGVRCLTVELPNPLPDSLKLLLSAWARDSFAGHGFVLDGTRYQSRSLDRVVVKTLTMDAEASLEHYVAYKQRPRGMNEYRQKDFRIRGAVRVENPPGHVRALARTYRAATGSPLPARVRIRSYRTTWGKKLVRKK